MNAVSNRSSARDAAAEKKKVRRLAEALERLPVPGEFQQREPIEFPYRTA